MPGTNETTCTFIKINGEPCRRKTSEGENRCWQHAVTLRHKWKSLTKNQTLTFFGVLASLLAIPLTIFVAWLTLRHPLTTHDIAQEVVKELPPPPRQHDVEKSPTEVLTTKGQVTVKHKTPSVSNPQEPPAFAVAIEVKLFVPGNNNEEGTGFWGVSNLGANCVLRSADSVMLIRIKNLHSIKTMITAYNLYGIGGEYNRIKMTTSRPVLMFPRTKNGPNEGFVGPASISIPTGSGNANGAFVSFKFADIDYSFATPMTRDILDTEIADHYLEPGETVRGWAFFQYPAAATIPASFTLTISDDLGHTYSYKIPDEAGNPSGDALRREITFAGPPLNLSSCTRLPHPSQKN